MTDKIVIKYPPSFDGELHITCSAHDPNHFTYTFTHASVNDNTWDTLVAAAQAILEQDRRKK